MTAASQQDPVRARPRQGQGGGAHQPDRARRQARLRRLRHRRAEGRCGALGAEEAAKLADGMGYPVVLKIVSPDILHKTEAGGVLVGLKSAEEVAKGYETILANARQLQGRREDRGRPGPADADRRTGSHHRRGHRRQLRQARGLRPRRRSGRGPEGHHLPPRAGDARRRAVDARRHPGGRDAEGRARRRAGRPRRARRPHPEGQPARQRLSRDRPRLDLNPVFATAGGRDRRRRAHRRRFRAAGEPATARARTKSSSR